MRQALDRLLEGDNEKEIALGLGLSRETVHEYVKRLHCHFEVSSRGELRARPLRADAGPSLSRG